MARVQAIIVAGGSGRRMQQRQKKQYIALDERPVLGHTLAVFDRCREVSRIFLVVPAEDVDYCQRNILDPLGSETPINLVVGGDRRQASVYNGLKVLDAFSVRSEQIVLIHDGVRPFVTPDQIKAVAAAADSHGAAILARPVTDTVKQTDENGFIRQTVDRKHLWLAQTPQGFRYPLIFSAHQRAAAEGVKATDDAALMEHYGQPVKVVEGSAENIKITTPVDLTLAQWMLAQNQRSCL